jgi:hypothetical protein
MDSPMIEVSFKDPGFQISWELKVPRSQKVAILDISGDYKNGDA